VQIDRRSVELEPAFNTPPVVNQERINVSVGVDVGGQALVASDLAADDDGEDHRRAALLCRSRCEGVNPPQMPCRSFMSSAICKHGSRSAHSEQMSLANTGSNWGSASKKMLVSTPSHAGV
jgi:hypothetical protein